MLSLTFFFTFFLAFIKLSLLFSVPRYKIKTSTNTYTFLFVSDPLDQKEPVIVRKFSPRITATWIISG